MGYAQRKRPASYPPIDYFNKPTILYVTVCTTDRARILDNQTFHECFQKVLVEADHWLLGKFMIMPDHIHFFCAPSCPEQNSVKKWIAYWKREICLTLTWEPGRWLRDGWDRQIRDGESYAEKWEYVRMNPVRAGYVRNPEDWPYQGELHKFTWID